MEKNKSIRSIDRLLATKIVLNNPTFLRELLDKGANPCVQLNNWTTPLLVATSLRQPESIQILIEYGADVNQDVAHGYTPLIVAVERNNVQAIQILLESGADLYPKGYEGNILSCVPSDDMGTFDLLLKHGADVNAMNQGPRLLNQVLSRGNIYLAEKLISLGIQINPTNDDMSPLFTAVSSRHSLSMLKLLLEKGGDLHATDYNKYTLLHTAAQEGQTEIALFLLEQGFDINCRSGDRCDTPLMLACKYEAMVALLIEHQADVNLVSSFGETALMCACRQNFYSAKRLLEAGANPNIVNQEGYSPLHYCAMYFHDYYQPDPIMLQLLLEHGADPNARDKQGLTPLDHLAQEDCLKKIRYLMQYSDLFATEFESIEITT